jgi:hypothetical protein
MLDLELDNGLVLRVWYEYEKGDKGVWRDSNNEGCPPTPSRVLIEKIELLEGDLLALLDLIANSLPLSELENRVLEEIE